MITIVVKSIMLNCFGFLFVDKRISFLGIDEQMQSFPIILLIRKNTNIYKKIFCFNFLNHFDMVFLFL